MKINMCSVNAIGQNCGKTNRTSTSKQNLGFSGELNINKPEVKELIQDGIQALSIKRAFWATLQKIEERVQALPANIKLNIDTKLSTETHKQNPLLSNADINKIMKQGKTLRPTAITSESIIASVSDGDKTQFIAEIPLTMSDGIKTKSVHKPEEQDAFFGNILAAVKQKV